MARIIVVTSGKGGVGKTTSSAAIATGLAQKGKKTVVIDFDIGLRNLDLIMGCERRVVYDFVNVIQGDATLNQALIKDKRTENLYILPASQTRDKDALTREGVEKVLDDLKKMEFDFVVCDSPAGIETGALMALYFADEAIITTNPEVSSVRDSDRILGILASKSRRAENGQEPIKEHLLLTRYNPGRVNKGDMLSMEDVLEILRIKLVGVIPEDQSVLRASNQGEPVILDTQADAGKAYADTVDRLLGEERPFRFIEEEKKGFLKRLFGGYFDSGAERDASGSGRVTLIRLWFCRPGKYRTARQFPRWRGAYRGYNSLARIPFQQGIQAFSHQFPPPSGDQFR